MCVRLLGRCSRVLAHTPIVGVPGERASVTLPRGSFSSREGSPHPIRPLLHLKRWPLDQKAPRTQLARAAAGTNPLATPITPMTSILSMLRSLHRHQRKVAPWPVLGSGPVASPLQSRGSHCQVSVGGPSKSSETSHIGGLKKEFRGQHPPLRARRQQLFTRIDDQLRGPSRYGVCPVFKRLQHDSKLQLELYRR